MSRRWRSFGWFALACLACTAPAAAQEVSPNPAPPGTLDAPPERIEPQPPVGQGGETLGEALTRTRGVIKPPPGIDPGLVEEPPPPGLFETPVIPPSAVTPGTAPR
jgi:hypothetical protein